jgi:hypothetical protein
MKTWGAVVITVVMGACGGGHGGSADAAPDAMSSIDAPPTPDAAPFPAFTPPNLPQVGSGGTVMASVRVVPIFLPGDALRDQAIDFLGKLSASTAWSEMVGEYGVGGAVAPPIDLTAPSPTPISDAEIQSFIQQQLAGATPAWGSIDAATLATTIYVLFVPASVEVTSGGHSSCSYFGGYHSFTAAPLAPSGGVTPQILYAVIDECFPPPSFTTIDLATLVLTHELVEAATDPTGQGFNLIPGASFAWGALAGPELGDLCELEQRSPWAPADIGYSIQRTWSNTSAAAGDDPCVPIPPGSGPYFAAVPDTPDQVMVGGGMASGGVNVPLGAARTIAVHLFSNGPTSGPWDVATISLTPGVDVAFDRTSGQNGDTLALTLHAAHMPPNGAVAIGITSTLAGRTTWWPLLVGVTP